MASRYFSQDESGAREDAIPRGADLQLRTGCRHDCVGMDREIEIEGRVLAGDLHAQHVSVRASAHLLHDGVEPVVARVEAQVVRTHGSGSVSNPSLVWPRNAPCAKLDSWESASNDREILLPWPS